jgi:hypothetical protein
MSALAFSRAFVGQLVTTTEATLCNACLTALGMLALRSGHARERIGSHDGMATMILLLRKVVATAHIQQQFAYSVVFAICASLDSQNAPLFVLDGGESAIRGAHEANTDDAFRSECQRCTSKLRAQIRSEATDRLPSTDECW